MQPVAFEASGLRIGLSVCYDLRFPELYRALGRPPCDLLCVPSSFTYTTGLAHWELLLRARAVENQCYVIAPAQGGVHENGRRTYGHSMIVDPWGEVLAQRDEGAGVVMAELDRGTHPSRATAAAGVVASTRRARRRLSVESAAGCAGARLVSAARTSSAAPAATSPAQRHRAAPAPPPRASARPGQRHVKLRARKSVAAIIAPAVGRARPLDAPQRGIDVGGDRAAR